MTGDSTEVAAARAFTANAATALGRSAAFAKLPIATRQKILSDLGAISNALAGSRRPDPYAFALEDLPSVRRVGYGTPAQPAATPTASETPSDQPAAPDTSSVGSRAATETLARRVGALSDEIDFPAFVAGLVHGTFDAIVDATIRQMEAFADLVSAVAKDVDQFTRENVTPAHVRDWLAERYPADVAVEGSGPQSRLRVRANGSDSEASPTWLADYGLDGQPLTEDLLETQVIPAATRTVGENRLKLLASMVLLGMSRVNIKDGTISARVRFRAAAQDKARVDYAVGQPGTWAERGSAVYDQHQTMVSTVGVNVQADSDLKVELFGEVRINFVSDMLPLESFADAARIRLLQQNARSAAAQAGHPAPLATLTPMAPTTPPSATPATPAATAPPTPTPAPAQAPAR